jgi:uncharacterized membrane protein YukC
MDEALTQKKDHDILITLVANVENLARSQDRFHKEVKDSFDDLKNNYSGRLTEIDKKLESVEKKQISFAIWKAWTIGYAVAVTPFLAWVIYTTIEHITHQ